MKRILVCTAAVGILTASLLVGCHSSPENYPGGAYGYGAGATYAPQQAAPYGDAGTYVPQPVNPAAPSGSGSF